MTLLSFGKASAADIPVHRDGFDNLPTASVFIDKNAMKGKGQLINNANGMYTTGTLESTGTYYKPLVLYKGSYNQNAVNNLPDFSIKYPSAAYDRNQTRYDVVLTFTNIKLVSRSTRAIDSNGFSLFSLWGLDDKAPAPYMYIGASNLRDNPSTGTDSSDFIGSYDVNITLYEVNSTNKANGTWLFYVDNLNNPDPIANTDDGEYAEAILIINGCASDIHVTNDTLLGWHDNKFFEQGRIERRTPGPAEKTSLAFLADASGLNFHQGSPHAITALFMNATAYQITATAGAGGTINHPGVTEVGKGWDSPEYTFTPDEAHQVSNVRIDGEDKGVLPTYTFTNVSQNHTIHVDFTDRQFTVKFVVDGQEIKTETVAYGHDATAPDPNTPEGYTFSGWDKTFTNVKDNLVINGTNTINKYTVTFKGEDGTVLKTETVNYGGDATSPTPPAITGKKFKEWDNTYTNIKQDTVVNAVYEDLTFTVKFVVDGQELKSETVVYGHDATAPNPNTPEGYTFSGWDKGFTNVTKDLIVNGTNTINQYTVTFKGEDGSVIKTETVNYGGDATAPTPPSVEGKTFNRWDKTYTNIKQDTIVNAIYDDVVLNVKFVIDGVEAKSEQVQYGHDATPPTNTNTPEGYVFSGWDKSYTNVKTDLVINGTNNINQYTVIFKGENGTELKRETVNYGGDATAPTPPSITGKHFTSWDKGYTNIKQDTVVNAIYEDNVYDVKFFIDNGLVKSEQVTHGRSATAPTNTNTPEGYTFSGWDKDFSNITSDLSVYGTNSPNKYTVVFKVDDKELKTESIAHGGAATAPEPPTIPGKKFTGWDKAYDKITGDLVVTAIYEDIYLTVDFVVDEKTVKSEQVLYGHAATAPEDLTIPAGCTFSGWDKPYDNVTENLTVKGNYLPIVYKVTFVMPDGSVIEIQEVNYGTDATAPQAPNINGKIFAGWDKEFTNVCSDLTVTAIYNDIPVVTPQSSDDAVQAIEATGDFGLVTILATIASSVVASFVLLLRRRTSIRK